MKIIWITAGSLIILLAAFHFWVVYHAEEIIQELVESKSNGKLKLEVKNFKFNWFSRKMELHEAVFYSADSATAGTSYRFAVRKINLKVSAMWPLIFDKKVLINNLELKDPDITVTRLRASKDKNRGDNVSVPQEMGRIYKSIQDALEVLQVKKFELDNASFTLINKIQPDQQPITISHIDLTIHDLKVDNKQLTGREKIFFSDNIVLKSRDQDILFPDQRHRLGFSRFRINIAKRIVEFDSCTIAAVKTEKSPTGFSIFFDRLVMTDIDFDTLYRAEVIKADSVYCINPVFKLTADLDKRDKTKKSAPKLDEIIRKLTGDLMLNFVVVNNASFDIQTIRDNNPSSFRSQQNNFEMQGLRIDNDAKRPLTVEKFAMAIRGYENFLRDSLYALQFDSIHVNNDRIFLNNFSFRRLNNGKTISNFVVPRFQLSGLSWDDLLFERRLTAHKATLYDPEIDFNEIPKKNDGRKKRSLFEVLESVNEVLLLEDMNIVNGDIRIHLNGGTELELKNATMSIESRNLLRSNQLSGIRRSVNYLDFSKGMLKIDDLTVTLDSINYTGDRSSLKARQALVTNTAGTLNAKARNVRMNEIFIDEFTGDVSIGGIIWEEADVDISSSISPNPNKKSDASFISLTDISGKNTRIHSTSGGSKIAATIDRINATAFVLKPGEKPVIAGLDVAGKNLAIDQSTNKLLIGNFAITDGKQALLEGISYKNKTGTDSTDIRIAKTSFIPDVQLAIEGNIRTSDLLISQPIVAIHRGGQKAAPNNFSLPGSIIDRLLIQQPVISFSKQTATGNWKLAWDGSQLKDPLVLTNVVTDSSSFSASQLNALMNTLTVTSAKGKPYNSGKAEFNIQLNDIFLGKRDSNNWKTTVTSIEGHNIEFDSLGKKNGLLKLQHVTLNGGYMDQAASTDIRSIINANKQISIGRLTGSYINNDDRFEWFNSSYNGNRRLFSLDSFLYAPVLDKDAFIKKKGYQADYIYLKTGGAVLKGFDPGFYFSDSTVKLETIVVNNVVFDDFRDNTPPFRKGIIKPLLTERIRSIPFKFSADSLLLNNAYVTYAELNPSTGQTGRIPISRIQLSAYPIRNYTLLPNDSLIVKADGYLLDTTLLRLRLHQSYTDSLSGFLVTAQIDPFDLRLLNPVLAPLSSVKIRSGEMDSLLMRINGDEYYAYGEVDMYYHDLKIRILKMAGKKSSKFRLAVANFIANSFVIKNNNTKRTGLAFFVRNRERSILNYLVKMLMSGVQSSVGVNRVRKEFRTYKKMLRQRNLPPANYD